MLACLGAEPSALGLWALHHLLVDTISHAILLEDLHALYRAPDEAVEAVLPGATFKLEQRLADDSWEIVPGHDALVTDAGVARRLAP